MSQQQSLVGGNGIVEIAELILLHGSTLSLQIDSSHYFEQAYNIVCSKSSNQDLKLAQYRGMAYRILALYFEEHSTEKKYYHILDRLSLLLKAAREYPNHRENLLQLVDVLANSFQGDLITYWNTVMNKIVQTWLKAFNNTTTEKKGEKKGEQEQVKDPENEEAIDQEEVISGGITLTPLMIKEYKQFLFQFITILLSSRIRSLLIPHMKSLKDVCINEMFYSLSSSKIATSSNKAASSSNSSSTSLNPLIAEFPDNEMSEYVRVMIHAFAVINGLENVEYWNDTLQWISSEMIQVTKQLSLPLKLEIKDTQSNPSGFRKPKDDEVEGGNDGNVSANKRAKLKPLTWEIIFAQKERGIQKALMLKNAFIVLTSLLNEIFSVGCSSGYITLDLTSFLALASKLLVYQKNVNVSDAATFIENEQGLSQVDINFVISQFKIALLTPYRTIVQLKHPSFVRFSSAFLQPVLSLWLKQTELSVLPDLMKEVLKTLSSLVEVFPAAITHYFNDSNYDYLPNIQSLFLKHCEAISEKRTYGNVEDVILSKPVPVTGNSTSVVPANKKQKKNDGTSNAKLSNDTGKKGKGKGKSGSSTEYTDILELMGQGKMKFYHNSEVENENDVYTILVFQLVEKILLYSFNYLSSPLFSYYINLGLHKVLTTLELGIHLHHLPDKRLLFQKNYQNSLYLPERIRLSLPLQEMVMSFTLTNILTFQQRPVQVQVNSLQAMLLGGGNHPHQKNGSGKDSMTEYLHLQQYHNNYYALNLQHYYHLCQTISSISSVGYEKVRDIATKGVLFVGHLLQPMNLPLPVVPPKDTIDYYRGEIDSFVNAINDPLYRSEKQIAAERLAAQEKEVDAFQEHEEVMVVEVPVIEGSVAEVKVLEIVRKSESELKELAERSSLNMITVNENKKRKFEESTLSTQTQKPTSKGKTQGDDDEDDDLPDIDISAD